MLIDPASVLAALHLPANSAVDFEPLSGRPDAPERIAICPPGQADQIFLVRRSADPEAALNHLAVMEALTSASFAFAPRLVAIIGDATVEEWIKATTALAVVPPAGACEAAVTALAALHGLPLREGLRWGLKPEDCYPDEEIPLHRLGFSSFERDPARGPLAAARTLLLRSPFGLVHGAATAPHVMLSAGRATLVNFEQAGYGPQLADVAAFLLTSGLEGPARRALAAHYARVRGLDPFETIDAIDVAGIYWGISELLALPRRQIEALGDDAASHLLELLAGRIERGLRAPAGDDPSGAAIRAALWPR